MRNTLLSCLALFFAISCFAEELPGIDAKKYPVKVIRRSKSNRVYLLEDIKGSSPRTGRILLLRDSDNNAMAFRIIKTYPGENQIAGRAVRRYPNYETLEFNTEYDGIEKISDLKLPPLSPEEAQRDQEDLKQIEEDERSGADPHRYDDLPKVEAYDPELDRGTSPPPGRGRFGSKSELDELIDETEAVAVEEPKELDPDRHAVSVQVGWLVNFDISGNPAYNTGVGMRYAYTFRKDVFLKKSKFQDSFSAELGLYLYKVLAYEAGNDTYTVLPLSGTVRYTVFFSEGFGLFGYLGLMKNSVLSGTNTTPAGITMLNSVQPALGLGMLFRFGPRWFFRVDGGYDLLGAGLMLRF